MKGQARLFIVVCIYCVLHCSHASAVDEIFDYSRTVRIIQVVDDGGYIYGIPRLFSIHEIGPKNRYIQLYEIITKYADRFESSLIGPGPAKHELLLINLSVRQKIVVGDSWLSDGMGYAILEDRDNQILQRILRGKIENGKKMPFENLSRFVDRHLKRYDMTEEQVDDMFSDSIDEKNSSDDVLVAPAVMEGIEEGPIVELNEYEEIDEVAGLNENETSLEHFQSEVKTNTLPQNTSEPDRDLFAIEPQQERVSRSEKMVATRLEGGSYWSLAIAVLVVTVLYVWNKQKKA